MKFLSRIGILLVIPFLNGCLEPFNPDVQDSGKSYLVVDGMITNRQGPYAVKITRSVSLNSEEPPVPVQGLEVYIEEEDGISEKLIEKEKGNYQTNGLQGETGRRYRLRFEVDGTEYLSSWEKINSSATIDSVYHRVEKHGTTDIENDVSGVQFYITNHGTSNDATYYRYQWEETWRIGVVYPCYQDYLGNDMVRPTENPRYTCWKYYYPVGINLATTQGLSNNILSEHKLPFVTGEDERLLLEYSLLVKQYSLDEKEYLFWKALKESNEQIGGLYDKQPGNISGNIYSNSTSKNDIVLGYFSACGEEQKRVFISGYGRLSNMIPCGVKLEELYKADLGDSYDAVIFGKLNAGKMFYNFIRPNGAPFPIGIILSDERCSDCQRKGGSTKKPDFWHD